MNEVVISTANVSIKEYQGNRVVTFKDIDTVHGRADGTARRNFNHNKEHVAVLLWLKNFLKTS